MATPIEDNNAIYNTADAAQSFVKSGLFPAEEKAIRDHIKKGMRILDIGCGTGRTTLHLAALDDTIVGVDYAESMILKARERFPQIHFEVADVRALPFEDSSFDVVFFSFNGLDYLSPKSERMKGLEEIKRVLKPGGVFIYSSHNWYRLPLGRVRLKEFWKNIKKGVIFSSYRWDHRDYGPLLTYLGSLWSEKRDLTKMGFQFLNYYGSKYKSALLVSLFESYTYYVFRKK